MSFLQPWMLWALPLISIPILIHLINQRRYQTVPWAAMTFLLTANRMSSGYARIRRWLILAARTVAIAGLLFAVARPLSSGWLGMAVGSRVDTTIVIVDRSPSMSDRNDRGSSKQSSLITQIIDTLNVVESNRTFWIDEDSGDAVELDSIDQLNQLAQPSAATSDIAAMMETAVHYIEENKPSSAEIWIASDLRSSDWDQNSGRWSAIRQSIQQIPQSVRVHLISATQPTVNNRSIRVTSAQQFDEPGQSKLLLSMTIRQDNAEVDQPEETVPLTLELNGARSQLNVPITGSVTEIANHSIPLDHGNQTGWGRVSLPADSGNADNDFYFVYGKPLVQKTVIVVEDALDGSTELAQPLMLAAGIPSTMESTNQVVAVTAREFAGMNLDDVAVVLWTQTLPVEIDRVHLKSLLDRGGRVLFFAPEANSTESFAGFQWGESVRVDQAIQVSSWIGDHDLLTKIKNGASLPVGELKVNQYRQIEGSGLTLARFPNADPLLVKAIGDSSGAYFITTGLDEASSSLATDGVVLYALIQRALLAGTGSLGSTRQLIAGETSNATDRWQRLAGDQLGRSTFFSRYAGIYSDDERLFAINRTEAEDLTGQVHPDQLESMFEGIRFDQVDQQSDQMQTLVQEVWRLFLGLMMLALVLEAILCLPKQGRVSTSLNRSSSNRSNSNSSANAFSSPPVQETVGG